MHRHSLTTPLSVLLAGLAVIVLLLIRPDTNSSAAPLQQQTAYPPSQATAYPGQATGTPGTRTTTPVSTTATTTRTATGTNATPTRTTTAGARTPTLQPTQFAPTDTPEPTESSVPDSTAVSSDSDTLVCAPGQTVEISGEGPPRAGFLLYFGKRVVSGGTVGVDGRFSIGLTVGAEGSGSYDVVVRTRGSNTILHELTCDVPATTPTPLPTR